MKRHTNFQFPCRKLGKLDLSALCLALPLILASSAVAGTNPDVQACGQKIARQANKLAPEKRDWLLEERYSEYSGDLDGDGAADSLTMLSTPRLRGCAVKDSWSQKETTVKIQYGKGSSRIFSWTGNQLVQRLIIYPRMGRILATGFNSRGESVSKWVEYRQVQDPVSDPRVAQPAGDESTEDLRVARVN